MLAVLLPPALAQTSPAAKVVTLAGQVSLLRDSSPWALRVGDSVMPRQIVMTGDDGFAVLQVSDGSTFQVFPNSRVLFRATPSNWTDLLDVLIGRVKVEIQKLGRQPNPNSVRTPTAVISVRGTVFDVIVEDDADTTFVSVDEGLVEVANLTAPGKTRLLTQGESIRVLRNVPLAKVLDKGTVAQGAMRAAADAIYEIIFRSSRGGVAGGGSGPVGGVGPGVPGQGDTEKPAPPPPPPSGPPPPPPPPPQ
jgi:hypothetical protein